MFNLTIFKHEIKNYYKLFLILTLISSGFMAVVMIMADTMPDIALPGSTGGSLLEIIGGAYYGVMGSLLFLGYVISSGNGLVAKEVDNGYLSYTLNSPVTRREVIMTKLIFHVTTIILMVLSMSLIGSVVGQGIFGSEFVHGDYWVMNLGLLLYLFAMGGLSFLSSCWFDKTNLSLSIGAGIPLGFFLISTIASFGEDFEALKYFTINTLFDYSEIVNGGEFILQFIVLLIIGVVLYSIGVFKFIKKDLPL